MDAQDSHYSDEEQDLDPNPDPHHCEADRNTAWWQDILNLHI